MYPALVNGPDRNIPPRVRLHPHEHTVTDTDKTISFCFHLTEYLRFRSLSYDDEAAAEAIGQSVGPSQLFGLPEINLKIIQITSAMVPTLLPVFECVRFLF